MKRVEDHGFSHPCTFSPWRKSFAIRRPRGAPGGYRGGQNEVPCFQLACCYRPESDEYATFLRVGVGQAQIALTMPPMNGGEQPAGAPLGATCLCRLLRAFGDGGKAGGSHSPGCVHSFGGDDRPYDDAALRTVPGTIWARPPLTLAIAPVRQGTSISVDNSMAAYMEQVDGIGTCTNRLTLEHMMKWNCGYKAGKQP